MQNSSWVKIVKSVNDKGVVPCDCKRMVRALVENAIIHSVNEEGDKITASLTTAQTLYYRQYLRTKTGWPILRFFWTVYYHITSPDDIERLHHAIRQVERIKNNLPA